MKISAAFPANYLRASDLDGQSVTVTIAKVILEQVSRNSEQQPVVYFKGKNKGMVLNKTNAKRIVEVFGDDTDNWVGAEIVLFETMVDFQGDTVAALRVRHVPTKQPFPESRPAPIAAETPGSAPSSILVEAEAMTKQGIDAFRAWRDGLREDEYNMLQMHMGRLIGLASQPEKPPMLSEAAKRVLKKARPPEIQEDVF